MKNVVLKIFLYFGGLILTGCATQIAYIPPVGPGFQIPSDFRIVGYFPSWSGNPEAVDYRALTDICYAFASPTDSGGYDRIAHSAKLLALVDEAHSNNVKVFLSLDGGVPEEPNAFPSIVADPELTNTFVDNTLGMVATYDLDGIDIDWEFPDSSQAQNFASLVHTLAGGLHAMHKLLSLAVAATANHGQNYLDSVVADADFLNIMAYDDGFGKPTGWPQSSYSFARAALDYWLDVRHVPPAKAILGVPFYGRSFKDHHSVTYRSILRRDSRASASDISQGYSYNGFDTIRAKTVNLARARGGGIMIWQLNQDAQGSASLLNAIFDAVKEPVDP